MHGFICGSEVLYVWFCFWQEASSVLWSSSLSPGQMALLLLLLLLFVSWRDPPSLQLALNQIFFRNLHTSSTHHCLLLLLCLASFSRLLSSRMTDLLHGNCAHKSFSPTRKAAADNEFLSTELACKVPIVLGCRPTVSLWQLALLTGVLGEKSVMVNSRGSYSEQII